MPAASSAALRHWRHGTPGSCADCRLAVEAVPIGDSNPEPKIRCIPQDRLRFAAQPRCLSWKPRMQQAREHG
jgi:hypothetical protein